MIEGEAATMRAYLAIDAEFQALIRPLTAEERAGLEASLLAEGCREALVVWQETGLLLDGHNRYALCQQHGLPFATTARSFPDRASALIWILHNQLGRRNLSPIDRVALALKLKPLLEAQAKARQGTRTDIPANLPECFAPRETREELATLANVSPRTVDKAAAILDHGSPALVQAVRARLTSMHAAVDIATLPDAEQVEIVARGKDEILAAAKLIRAERAHLTHFTGEFEWYTPAKEIALVRQVLGDIELDPASHPCAQATVKATRYFSQADDALTQDWTARTVWLNPPYAQPLIVRFITKLLEEWHQGHIGAALLLTHNSTETTWFQRAGAAATALCFPSTRIRFVDPTGDRASPTQGQTYMYFGPEPQRFARIFGPYGLVLQRGWDGQVLRGGEAALQGALW